MFHAKTHQMQTIFTRKEGVVILTAKWVRSVKVMSPEMVGVFFVVMLTSQRILG